MRGSGRRKNANADGSGVRDRLRSSIIRLVKIVYDDGVNIERTMEFILESQAKTETRLAAITRLMQQGIRQLAKNESAIGRLAEAQRKTESRLAAFQERTDARLAASQERTDVRFRELADEVKELAKAQKTTERIFQAFIKGKQNGRNGR